MEGPDENKDVLGSLPRRRPGIKSPRRAGERAAAEQRATAPPPASAPVSYTHLTLPTTPYV